MKYQKIQKTLPYFKKENTKQLIELQNKKTGVIHITQTSSSIRTFGVSAKHFFKPSEQENSINLNANNCFNIDL
ncbi:MAG: hypothetical protein MI974_34005 [Chitinophagales bacterium]|nr:hypothetical protein [Chitinophagales bacterium]